MRGVHWKTFCPCHATPVIGVAIVGSQIRFYKVECCCSFEISNHIVIIACDSLDSPLPLSVQEASLISTVK